MKKTDSDRVQQTTPGIREIVGERIYADWMDMLRRLVPHGRTHRLSVLVAAFLQYAGYLAYEKMKKQKQPEESAAALLFKAWEGGYPEESESIVCSFAESLFRDAGVRYMRVNHKGQKYSIAEDAVFEFIKWEDMPWE